MSPVLSHPKARTVAIIGRSGVGKTSLLESLVVATGGLERPGLVQRYGPSGTVPSAWPTW